MTAAVTATTPAAPVINSVECTSTGNGGNYPVFSFTWTPQQGYTGPFTVVVTTSSGLPVNGTTSAASAHGATWTATQSMNAAGDMYYAQAAVASNTGIASDKAPLLFAPVTAITTRYDGITLQVAWTAPASQMPAGQSQLLLLTPAGAQGTVSDSGTSASLVVNTNLRDSGGAWSVYVTPQQGISAGPTSAPAPAYGSAPTVTSAGVLGSNATLSQISLTLGLSVPGQVAAGTAALAILKANGAVVQTTAPASVTWAYDAATQTSTGTASAQFSYPINLAATPEVAAALSSATAGTATGPTGIGSGLVLLAPQAVIATVTAQGSNRLVSATLSPQAGPWSITGSRIGITGPSGFSSIGQAGYSLQSSLTLTNPAPGGAYLLYGAQASGTSMGPWSGTQAYPGNGAPAGGGVPLITSIPALASIAVDHTGQAALTWSSIPDAGRTGYQVSVMAGTTGAVLSSAVFAGTSASLPAQDGAAFSVAGVGTGVTGPGSAAVLALTGAPAGLASAWSSTGASSCTLTWSTPAGGAVPDGYTVDIYSGATRVHQDTGKTSPYTVPAGVLTTAGGFSFRVRATRSGAPTLSGPSSTAATLLTAAPGGLAVHYDGATLSASWGPVPGATGYRAVLVLGGAESGDPWYTAEPATSVPLAFDSTKAYSLTVQACGPGSTGPAASAAVFGAGFYPQFATDTLAALIPATLPAMAPYAIALGLPQIFTSPPAQGDLPSAQPFVLTQLAQPSATGYYYLLTIDGAAGSLPWTFTTEARADLYTAYTTFLGQLDGLGATAYGLQAVQAAIARSMPQAFVDSLLYTYGFDGQSGWVDLTPGMVLRVEYESYQTMGAGTTDQAYLNGFITSAVAQYQITRAATNATGFTTLDAFIGWLTGLQGTDVSTPATTNRKQAGGGGLIDSGYTLMQQPYLRLVYPPGFPSTDQPGTPYPEFNAVLLAASKLSDLTAATHNIRTNAAAGAGVGVLYFRGRTTLVPQIRVWVNGVEQLVPVGTTVGDILAQRGMAPPAIDLPLAGIRMRRGTGAALVGSPATYDAGTPVPVRLDWAPSGQAALAALPLLGGDSIDLGAPAAGNAAA